MVSLAIVHMVDGTASALVFSSAAHPNHIWRCRERERPEKRPRPEKMRLTPLAPGNHHDS